MILDGGKNGIWRMTAALLFSLSHKYASQGFTMSQQKQPGPGACLQMDLGGGLPRLRGKGVVGGGRAIANVSAESNGELAVLRVSGKVRQNNGAVSDRGASARTQSKNPGGKDF